MKNLEERIAKFYKGHDSFPAPNLDNSITFNNDRELFNCITECVKQEIEKMLPEDSELSPWATAKWLKSKIQDSLK